MPNRILKESICTSDNLDRLSIEAEVFFYRLMVQCDDYGRMDARAAILLSRCYPLRLGSIATDNIKAWLDELRKAELIITYDVDGKPYLQFTTWDKHQQVRAKRSKYPAIDDGLITSDSNCNQLITNVPVIQSNPIQSESESKSISAKKPRALDMHFENLASICQMTPPESNWSKLAKSAAGQLNKFAKELRDIGAEPDQIISFGQWWYQYDWRGKQGQPPKPADVPKSWTLFLNGVKPNGNGSKPNGRRPSTTSDGQLSPEDQAISDILTADNRAREIALGLRSD